jgi:uncharacterized protein (TIGR00288 family)
MSEERLKIAVFIDFDNIEIGVKTTLSRRFDVGTVLEAIKERGEVVTKIAYGNWKMAEDYSRAMTEHAVQMVQRNVTPGGDKNGADINLALDALEMAFTRNHINAFVIVGGDSDFIALVEKLKQYDKKVIIVGGRAFTSAILQKNCHEFLAYENLIGAQPGTRRSPSGRPMGRVQLETALPLVRRALKVLSEREVSPQLGLLKSTLLQLDSTFSERDFGTSTFREFIQRVANSGYVVLKQVDRSLIVELRDGDVPSSAESAAQLEPAPQPEAAPEADAPPRAEAQPREEAGEAQSGAGFSEVVRILQNATSTPRWPMYLRNLRQYFRSMSSSFDERRLGFGSFHDLLRHGQREGVFRLERNKQGIIRIFPGDRFPQRGSESTPSEPMQTMPLEPEPMPDPGGDFRQEFAPEVEPEIAESQVEAVRQIMEDVESGAPEVIDAEPPSPETPGEEGPGEESQPTEEPAAEGGKPRRRTRTSSRPAAPRRKGPAPRRTRAPRKSPGSGSQ